MSGWIAPFGAREYAQGAHASDARDGDVLFVRHRGGIAWVIAFGQFLMSVWHRALRSTWKIDHVALVRVVPRGATWWLRDESRYAREGEVTVAEMGFYGHEHRLLRSYAHKFYFLVRFDVAQTEVQRVADADDCYQGSRYNFLTYVGMVAQALTGYAIGIAPGREAICSEAVKSCGTNVYWFDPRSSSSTPPCRLAQMLHLEQPKG